MRKLLAYFVRYPIWSNAIIVIFLVGGIIGFFNLKKSFFPEVPSRIVTVTVVMPGASPEEMEEGVTLKVEKALKGIAGVEQITSVSSENLATVTIEGKQGYDPELLLADVKNAVDKISSFPREAEKPVVYKPRSLGQAITLVLTGKKDLLDLKKEAEIVEDELLGTGFISQVTLSGFPDREISIELSEDQLLRYNLTFSEVASAVALSNTNVTGGTIKSASEEIIIRADNKGYSPRDLEDIVIRRNPDGTLVRLMQVVDTIREGFSDNPKKTLYNGQRAITIDIQKLIEEDIMEITDFVKKFVKEYNTKHSNLKLSVITDQSVNLQERIDLLISNGVTGLILVIVCLGFFLNLRLSFWVAWGIPFSFLGMFIIATLMGVTINMISLFGMILVIGILVDDGIVVGENIYSHIEKGKSPVIAAIDGSLEVLPSVFTSVTTTIVVFCTFFFMGGRMGEFIQEMAIVVIASLIFSLIECTLVLPAHLSHGKGGQKEAGRFRKMTNSVIDHLRINIYGKVLKAALNYRYIVMTIPVFFIMMTIGLMMGGVLNFTFFPRISSTETKINLVMKPGTRETKVEELLNGLNAKVWELNRELMDSLHADSLFISTKIDIGTAENESGGHCGTLAVTFCNEEKRDMSSDQLEMLIRKKIGKIKGAEKMTIGGRIIFGKPVDISLVGKDLAMLESAKDMLKAELEEYIVLKDISDNRLVGKREVKITELESGKILGLTHEDIARQVRMGFFGLEVQRLQKGQDEVRVWVRYPESGRTNLGRLDQMKIKTPSGEEFNFSDVASYNIERGIVSINHFNGMREIRVTADMADPNTPVSPVLNDIKENVVSKVLSAHPGIRAEYLGQERESQRVGANMPLVMLCAFGFMFLLIALTFRSLPQALLLFPLIILGVMGSLWGHGLHAKPVSMLSLWGILALTGIVVNDAVVLMSKFNSLIKEGIPMREAVYQAGIARFRAIVLTSVTTVAGLYPLILNDSHQAQFLIPMAISVAYGVLFGTVFILIFFPVLILVLNDFRCLILGIWYGRSVSRDEVEPAYREDIRLKKIDQAWEENQ